jgi:hypothetical protein
MGILDIVFHFLSLGFKRIINGDREGDSYFDVKIKYDHYGCLYDDIFMGNGYFDFSVYH